jgi:hypothetical protein
MLERKGTDMFEMYDNVFFGPHMGMIPFEAMDNTKRMVNKGMDVYRAWLGYLDAVTDKGFELGYETISGQEVNVDSFFETLREAHDDFTKQIADTLNDTPFKGLNDIGQAMKQTMDPFSEQQEMAIGFFKELCDINTKMFNLSVSVMKETKTPPRYENIIDFCAAFVGRDKSFENTNKSVSQEDTEMRKAA